MTARPDDLVGLVGGGAASRPRVENDSTNPATPHLAWVELQARVDVLAAQFASARAPQEQSRGVQPPAVASVSGLVSAHGANPDLLDLTENETDRRVNAGR